VQSPLVWDSAHIGHFEELWLLRNVGGAEPLRSEHDDVYDAFAHVRTTPPAAPRRSCLSASIRNSGTHSNVAPTKNTPPKATSSAAPSAATSTSC
jgi:hypothetical protein